MKNVIGFQQMCSRNIRGLSHYQIALFLLLNCQSLKIKLDELGRNKYLFINLFIYEMGTHVHSQRHGNVIASLQILRGKP